MDGSHLAAFQMNFKNKQQADFIKFGVKDSRKGGD